MRGGLQGTVPLPTAVGLAGLAGFEYVGLGVISMDVEKNDSPGFTNPPDQGSHRMTDVANNSAAARFAFDNTYARQLEGLYVPWKAAQVAQPRLVKLNRELAEQLGLDAGA